MQTCLVQVPRQLDRRLHLHLVLEEAAAERGLVVGLVLLGLSQPLEKTSGCESLAGSRPVSP